MLSEVRIAIKKSRSRASTSLIDQIGYVVFKKYPSLLPVLSNLFQACWSEKSVPSKRTFGVMKLIQTSIKG